ncbi:hypothetical protein PT974_06449 [Cladobotryum mycophilum]|uniref:Uncharacterized protein n=1 Tax=Cladobotryum mycophilum TaxID=491253 RepID=A0ABR0SLM3_9HYPO
MASSKREYRFADNTCEALKANLTLRFLVKIKHKFESRHSRPVIAWAQTGAHAITAGLLKQTEQEDTKYDIQMQIIQLLDDRTRTFFCFDVFLEGCEAATRTAIEESTRQPIHFLFKQSNICYARRDHMLDAIVAGRLEGIRKWDKGPKPYFYDAENPPFYTLGRRVEGPEDGEEPGPELEDRSEEEESEVEGKGEDGTGDDRLEKNGTKEDEMKKVEMKEDVTRKDVQE